MSFLPLKQMMFLDISEGKCPSYLKGCNAAYREENMNVQGQAPIEPHYITTRLMKGVD